jgi:hypothetical protein
MLVKRKSEKRNASLVKNILNVQRRFSRYRLDNDFFFDEEDSRAGEIDEQIVPDFHFWTFTQSLGGRSRSCALGAGHMKREQLRAYKPI